MTQAAILKGIMSDQDNKADLQSLYPTALTESQVYEKNLERRLRLPTPPSFFRAKITLSLGLVYFSILLLVFNLEYLWAMGMSGVSVSFLVMVGIGIGAKSAVSYVSQIFEMFAKSTTIYLLLSALYIILLSAGHQFGGFIVAPAPITALILSGIFSVLSFVTLCVILRRQQ